MKTTLLRWLLFMGLTGCKEELFPLTPPDYSISIPGCHPPAIDQNIVGTWHFESNLANNGAGRVSTKGTVTFDQKGNIIDPDTLFSNDLGSGQIRTKTYNPAVNSPFSDYPQQLFVVYRTFKDVTNTSSSAEYFYVVSNECDRIHISSLHTNNEIGFVLTK
ncbi:hypothetical protein EXU85_24170 [Spirosoma sp. KCTC 42546]|uniref:hypothetical protein n=1 Tax=Spirosoma sp. KCTC 42546 TaxID=2520506 RepID=UPI00115B2DEE|nr:hypothetical protein [Spirosoma sp. KCTC 42546]QDK81534.1 hypothetical protein EXU85_24170 [Spirosoma sp. KCTC 42546]